MADRAAALAAFLRSDEGGAHRDEDALLPAGASCWPDLADDAIGRSFRVGGRARADGR